MENLFCSLTGEMCMPWTDIADVWGDLGLRCFSVCTCYTCKCCLATLDDVHMHGNMYNIIVSVMPDVRYGAHVIGRTWSGCWNDHCWHFDEAGNNCQNNLKSVLVSPLI